jgi:hypothetical protein
MQDIKSSHSPTEHRNRVLTRENTPWASTPNQVPKSNSVVKDPFWKKHTRLIAQKNEQNHFLRQAQLSRIKILKRQKEKVTTIMELQKAQLEGKNMIVMKNGAVIDAAKILSRLSSST